MFYSQARQTATGENPVKSPSAPSQVPVSLYSAAAASRGASEYESFTHVSALQAQPPSLEQLRTLLAIPSGMLSASRSSSGRARQRKGRKGSPLAKEGQIMAKVFDALGANRPYPTNNLSLEQSIRVELTLDIGTFISSSSTNGASTYAAQAISVGQFSGAASLLAVFDQYRIVQLEAWIESDVPNAVATVPNLVSAIDLDDANVPVSVGNVSDHQGSITSMGPSGHYHRWMPHLAVSTYSGTFTSYGNVPCMWIDSASPNVQHFGLKAATTSTGATMFYNLTVRAVVDFRAPTLT
jgi:hypothetical protein